MGLNALKVPIKWSAVEPAGTAVDSAAMDTAKTIVEQRVNGLGVTEPLVQRQGASRIVVELPGVKDPKAAIDLLKQSGLNVQTHAIGIAAGGPKADALAPLSEIVLPDVNAAIEYIEQRL